MDAVRPKGAEFAFATAGMGDHPSASALFGAIALALFDRERTGKGRRVRTSLMANGAWSNSILLQAALCGGTTYARAAAHEVAERAGEQLRVRGRARPVSGDGPGGRGVGALHRARSASPSCATTRASRSSPRGARTRRRWSRSSTRSSPRSRSRTGAPSSTATRSRSGSSRASTTCRTIRSCNANGVFRPVVGPGVRPGLRTVDSPIHLDGADEARRRRARPSSASTAARS